MTLTYKIGVSRGPFVFKNFINRGAGNTELMSNFRCTSALLMKRQHDVPVHGTPAPNLIPFSFASCRPSFVRSALLQIVGGDKLIIPFADGAAHEPIQRPAFSA